MGDISFAIVSGESSDSIMRAIVASGLMDPTRNVFQPMLSEIIYNTETDEIKINAGYGVTYADNSRYNVRIYIRGNTETGLFDLKLMSTGSIITGHGYAKGEDKHYLFQVDLYNNLSTTDTPSLSNSTPDSPKYFCIPSGASLEDLQNMDDEGLVGDEGVPSLPPADSDHPCSAYVEGLQRVLQNKFSNDTKELILENFEGGGEANIGLNW